MGFSFAIKDLKEVNTGKQEITLDLQLIIDWRDSRLTCGNDVS